MVAVSGGLDSMVLLQVLSSFSRQHRWRITVAHFNHRLRGEASDLDEQLVRRTCDQLGHRIFVGRADTKLWAAKRRISIEMAGRELRHTFLAATAKRLRIS